MIDSYIIFVFIKYKMNLFLLAFIVISEGATKVENMSDRSTGVYDLTCLVERPRLFKKSV